MKLIGVVIWIWILRNDELKLALERKKTYGVKRMNGVKKMDSLLKLVEERTNGRYLNDVLFYVPNVLHLSLDPCHSHY